MAKYQLTYKRFGEHSILIEWPNRIDEDILKDILIFKKNIETNLVELIIETIYAYNSILITYKNSINDIKKNGLELNELYKIRKTDIDVSSKLWKIPVCYDLSFGIDSEELIRVKNISFEQLVTLHTNTLYTVYFIGFLPGFLYLGGLDEQLFFPRKSIPRLTIKKGSVAIGQSQTGIYPNDSPGGWNIIGNTPINLFNPNQEIPCVIKGGDKIQFYPISLEQHNTISQLVEANVYQMESEVLSG